MRRRKIAPSTALCRLWRGAGDVWRGAPCGGSSGGCRQWFEPSRGGPGWTGSSMREAFVPLHHPPGHARVDFGEAVVELRGQRGKVAFFCLILPHSDVWFVKACPRGDDGGLSGRPYQHLRLPRQGPTLDPLRQHGPDGGADSGDRHAPVHAGLHPPAIALSVPRPLRPARRGQGRGPGEDGTAPVHGADPEGARPVGPERAADGTLPGASRRVGGR